MGFRAWPRMGQIPDARKLADAVNNQAPTKNETEDEWVPGEPDASTHSGNHEDGGTDELSVQGLSGTLADPQTPQGHSATHESGAADEVNVGGLGGTLADPQTPQTHAGTHASGGGDPVAPADIGAVATADVETGSATFSGDGIATVFTISHGLGAAPSWPGIVARSADAAGDKFVSSVSSTGIEVTFASAPASGTDNVVLDYHARL